MKKTLALVLALAMVFSTITVAFAEGTLSAEAQIAADLGMLKGETGTVDAAYTATAPTRLQSAVMFLRLKGLEAEALAFTGEANFADGNIAWAEGRNLLAYLKANPQLGWAGDGTNFNPNNTITAKEYYKVLLEALGYKQTVAGVVVGDFTWDNVLEFAALKGLSKVATVTNYTVNDLAIATVEALKLNVKDTEKTLVATLVEAGKVDEAKAVAAGLIAAAPEAVAAKVDTVTAVGNTVVEVVFEDDVDATSAGDVANYAIEGLAINSAVVAGSDTVRLETATMTSGKVYVLTVGEDSVKFTGAPKVSGAPAIDEVVSEDVEEVVITFTKNMDFATATDVANYTISGVEVVEADIDGTDVTLTTKGLAARKQYTVKVKNVKSVDGALMRSDSESFYTKLDTAAPKFAATPEAAVTVETNQRVVVLFNEKVTKESAENIENYTIKTATGDTTLEVLSATLKTSDGSTKERKVTLVTEVQAANKKYELSVVNVSDKTKAGNTIKKAIKDTFFGDKDDTKAPVLLSAEAVGRNLVKVSFTDESKIDPDTALDPNAYTLKKTSPAEDYAVEKVEEFDSANGSFVALLTTEELPTGTFNVKVEGVGDEFGNVLDEKDKNFSVSVNTTFAAATVDAVDFVDKNGDATGNYIRLHFTKDLVEESAEDIANYSIDGDIGAPISAEYTNDYVYLKTNDLKANTMYEITVNGTTDLAGNVLDFSIDEQYGNGWDTTAPKLDSAYSLNKYVVALAFDEEIDEYALGRATLTLRDAATVPVAADVTLTAKALKEDGTVVEFSNYNTANPATSVGKLVDGVTYKVYAISSGIRDLNKQAFVRTDDFSGYTVQGTNDDPDRIGIASIAQRDGKTFTLTMDGNVLLIPGQGAEYTGWTLGDETDKDEVITFQGSKLTEAAPGYQEFNLSAFLTDEHGVRVLDDGEDSATYTDKTKFFVEYADDDKPYIVNVVAKDRTTLEVEYSERIASGAINSTFSVKNADEDVSKTNIFSSATIDKTKVIITLSAPLQSIYDYELKIVTANINDLVGNVAEEKLNDTFSFDGTDLVNSPVADMVLVP